MELIEQAAFADGALLLLDAAPIVYLLDGHPVQSPRFAPFVDAAPAMRHRHPGV